MLSNRKNHLCYTANSSQLVALKMFSNETFTELRVAISDLKDFPFNELNSKWPLFHICAHLTETCMLNFLSLC